MAQITFKGAAVHTAGDLPAVGSTAPDFTLTKTDLSDLHLGDLEGKTVILNIFPSVDTSVCASSVRTFNERAAGLDDTVVVCVSMDLPFALKRFCGAEGIEGVEVASAFRSPAFATSYGVAMRDGPLRGLLSRAVVVVDPARKVAYTEQVTDIGREPNYEAALGAAKR